MVLRFLGGGASVNTPSSEISICGQKENKKTCAFLLSYSDSSAFLLSHSDGSAFLLSHSDGSAFLISHSDSSAFHLSHSDSSKYKMALNHPAEPKWPVVQLRYANKTPHFFLVYFDYDH